MMWANNDGLDEMQRDKRNKVGNQMFMIMFYALFFESALQSVGLRWISYPGNVMAIIMACMSVYLARIIAVNAYLPPKAMNREPGVKQAHIIIFSMALAAAGAYYIFGGSAAQTAITTDDNSALILVIVSGVGLLASIIAWFVGKANNRRGDE